MADFKFYSLLTSEEREAMWDECRKVKEDYQLLSILVKRNTISCFKFELNLTDNNNSKLIKKLWVS